MAIPLHSHRYIQIIMVMPLMVIVIGQVIHRHRYASTHSFVFSLVSEVDVVRLGLEKRVLPGRSRVRFARTLILPLVECFADDDVHTLHVGFALCSSAIARVLTEYV